VTQILWIGYQTFFSTFYKTQSIFADGSLIDQLKSHKKWIRDLVTTKMWAANAWPEKSFLRKQQRRGNVCLPGPILQSEGAGVGGNVQVTGRARPTWTKFNFYNQRIRIRLLGQVGSGYPTRLSMIKNYLHLGNSYHNLEKAHWSS
jgi:hypothetical protein